MAFIPPEFADDVISRTRLSDVVGRAVKLTRKGREHSGLCPFHGEKTPSFTVNDEKGFYHCFGCGAHGNAVRFLMDYEKKTYPDAVAVLAAEAGMALPEPARAPEEERKRKRRERLLSLVSRAAEIYVAALRAPHGKKARDYLQKRGVTPETAAHFGIGYAPDAFNFLSGALTASGASAVDLIDAGLAASGERGPYDRFRDRLLFPIHDAAGKTIGFGGRAFGDAQPKYLNSPQCVVFDKGHTLYNLHRAKKFSHADGVVAVEGYMDVVKLTQFGLPNVVAPMGTALGEAQLRLLWRCADRPVICMDGDAAGRRAMARVVSASLPLVTHEKSLAFLKMPAGKDPDEFVSELGGAAMKERLARGALSFFDALREILFAQHPSSTPEGVAARMKEIDATADKISDVHLKNAYRRGLVDAHWQEIRARKNARFSQGKKTPSLAANAFGDEAVPLSLLPSYDAPEGCEWALAAILARLGAGNLTQEVERDATETEWREKDLDKIIENVLDSFSLSNGLEGIMEKASQSDPHIDFSAAIAHIKAVDTQQSLQRRSADSLARLWRYFYARRCVLALKQDYVRIFDADAPPGALERTEASLLREIEAAQRAMGEAFDALTEKPDAPPA
ncbi:MAG: DNA primase [Rickettsiales bacterium]